MKLYELINFTPIQSSRGVQQYKNKVSNIPGSDVAGTGEFGTAYELPSSKRQNQVTKVARAGSIRSLSSVENVEEDGYLTYLNAIHNLNSDNPYFPRIHDLKIMKDKNGKLTYRANIERLVSFYNDKIFDNDELMRSLYDDMFIKELSDPYGDADAGKMIHVKLDRITNYRSPISDIKDPELKEALQLIFQIKNEGGFVIDLHGGNIMWRITGTRPQLVILDPLA